MRISLLIAKLVSKHLLKKHEIFTDKMLDIVYDTQYLYHDLEKNKLLKTKAVDDGELRSYEQQEKEIDKMLKTRKNALIKIIMAYSEDYKIKTRNEEPITEEMLQQKTPQELAEFSEKLLNKVMKFDFTE